MIHMDDIGSWTDFQRRAKSYLRKLRASGRPRLLTVNGKPALIVQDAAAYEKMMETLEYAETVASIQEGLASADRGEGVPLKQAFKKTKRKLRI